MATMKCPNLSTGHNMAVNGSGTHLDDVDLFGASCWQSAGGDYIDINHKLILDSTMSSLGSPLCQDDGELEGKVTMDALDTLLNSQQLNTSLAELKPLPPFTGYTANLSINGIPGHHYHTISQRIPEENNNTYGGFGGGGGEQAIVSSSTCGMESGGGESGCGGGNNGGKYHKLDYTECVNPDSVSGAGKVFGDECGPPIADSVTAHIKTELPEYDIGSIGSIDIAAIIGSAIADTTVSGGNHHQGGQDVTASANDDGNNSRDSWMDIEQWIDGACVDQHTKSLIIAQEGLSEFVMPNSNSPSEYSKNQPVEYNTGKMQQQQQTGSTLQTLLTHGYMPLLQNRLQNGPPIKQEAPSSTNYGTDMISTSSPPSNVVSTTDSLMLNVNGRFLSQYGVHGLDADHRIRSPESMVGQNYPHPTTTTPATPKKPRSRAQKKQQSVGSSVLQAEQSMGVLGREKPVHRCNICNRGFLNKSNIKVHLRTHTGEKPFRCDTCAKAFRQKAHLLKHQQIHKRIGRD